MAEKLVIMVTNGPDDPELAVIPFVMATAAQASEVDVLMGFQGNGVWLVRKDIAKHVLNAHMPPLSELLEAYQEAGGKLYVCGPCVKSRDIGPDEFIEGATVVNAATFVAEVTSATNVLVY
jgi:predicted peroxiredoxin